MKKKCLFIFLLTCLTMLEGDSFVVKPKKKTTSNSSLKESIGQISAYILKKAPEVHRTVADLQDHLMCTMSELLEGEKNGFIGKASKEDLQAYLDELEHLEAILEQFRSDITKRVSNLEKKSGCN